MKTMTCKQLGGACDKEFTADTFDEIADMSKTHGMEMFQANDADHLKAMGEMQELMQEPKAMGEWFENKRKEFETIQPRSRKERRETKMNDKIKTTIGPLRAHRLCG